MIQTEERITDLEDKTIETTLFEQQRKQTEKRNQDLGACGTIAKDLTL